MNVKPIEQAADKFVNNASSAGPSYVIGINNPKRPWEAAALEGEANYKAGVTAAANAGRFGKGIKKSGQAKYQTNAIAKAGRFGEGVSLAKSAWSSGVSPYFAALQGLTLPKKGVRGSPGNIERVKSVNTALRQVFERQAA